MQLHTASLTQEHMTYKWTHNETNTQTKHRTDVMKDMKNYLSGIDTNVLLLKENRDKNYIQKHTHTSATPLGVHLT